MATNGTGTDAHERSWSRPQHPALALGLLCAAQFMVIVDLSIVNVALPAIGRDLDFADQSGLQLVISLYALPFGGLLILAGRLADLFSSRRMFLAGLTVFTAGSVVCALATSSVVLLTRRSGQGIGSALISTAALSLLTSLFAEGRQRNRALGAWGTVGGAAGGAGLLLGGVLTQAVGWEGIFWINVPIGLAAILFAPRLLHAAAGTGPGSRRLDLPGAVTVTAGLGLVIFGLSRSRHLGLLAPPPLFLLGGGIALLSAFVVLERRGRHPLVDVGLLRLPGIARANLAAGAMTTVVAATLFFTTLYVQDVLGYSPLHTGLAFLPNEVMVVLGSALASRLAGRMGSHRVLAVGLVLLAASSALLAHIDTDGRYLTDLLPAFLLMGFCLGLAFVTVTIAATTGVIEHQQGLASGLVNTAQQVGVAAVVTAAATLTTTDSSGAHQQIAVYGNGYLINTIIAGLTALLVIMP